jgi:hypothetical protein
VDLCDVYQVDLLPEISQAPRILSDVESALKNKQLKAEVDDYLKACIFSCHLDIQFFLFH